ncbi:NmrA family NAD(P)-binding protein [Nocardioides KLBMP 9356]|uniref:NmrA family NAD(P)-binding protein n=1 Tax=Nocardioides potassii TaxID=2911371 RepID=A0ABS9HD27_9ACTN|nr:NmrA family NAD(P)-binding protein [Nocardioides potassii]MCF6378018.1 NmrA family NAD(P)-binding protein [Nocardioides potassii]
MIVITGATGRLGSLVVEKLLARVPASEVGVSVRDPQAAHRLAAIGVRVRRGDFTAPETLLHSFEGAVRVLVVSAPLVGAEAVEANTAAIDAAVAAGAERVAYTGHQAASPTSLFTPQPVHAATQDHLAGAGVPFTALRNGFYASTVPMLVADALETGELRAPADGPVSWTDHGDLAEAAVAALLGDPRLDGVTAPLTAQRAFDLTEVAALLSEMTGRAVERRVVDDEEWVATQVAAGTPEGRARFALTMHLASRAGEFDITDPLLGEVLERPTTPLREVLAREVLGQAH